MKQFQHVITDPLGLHARPAGLLVQAAKALCSTVTLEKADGTRAEATRLLSLMMLDLQNGDPVTVTIEGGNEEASLQAMEQFFWEHL